MDSDQSNSSIPDKKGAAVCGLFCPACSAFIGSTEEPARLQTIANNFQVPVEKVECKGCRSDKRGLYCENYCKMTRCAAEKGIDFCYQCQEYPCSDIKTFQALMPHRIELWQSQDRIKEVGWERWYAEMVEHYSCPDCGTINSAYDMACRKCGRTPANRYVELHKDEIVEKAGKMRL